MIEITIEIKEVMAGTQKAIDVGLMTKKANDTPVERGIKDRILPAGKNLLKDSGLLGEPAK